MLSTRFKFNYSSGAIANGIKTDMFTFFLLFFYSRVIGLDPLLASLAIGLALIVDSFTDPIMGTISDRTNTKFGRRHPFMFVSFLPVGIFYILLFSPTPEWNISQNQLFWWMFICTSFTRIGMTLFDVPHRSFGALTGGLTLWVLNISKDTPTYDQAYALFFVQGVIGPILLVIPLIFFYFYSLDKKRHSEILMKIEERNNF